MSDIDPAELKRLVVDRALELGASLVRSCPTDRWEEHPIQDRPYRPRSIWPWAENAIVMGIPVFAPMVATTPSMVHQELYNTSNRILDDMAYRMTAWLTSMGHRAVFFPRDCYYNIEVLLDDPTAAFSHVLAGYYSGMGTIGASHNLLTQEFGPRVRMVTVLTDADIEADPMLDADLCLHCGKCMRRCPAGTFSDGEDGFYDMNMERCVRHHLKLKGEHHWPCGICLDVCPVGDDLARYRGAAIVTPEGRDHCGRHGS